MYNMRLEACESEHYADDTCTVRVMATMPETLAGILLGVVRVEPEGLNWCPDPDGREVLAGECNGCQLVRAVQVNLISPDLQRLMLEAAVFSVLASVAASLCWKRPLGAV